MWVKSYSKTYQGVSKENVWSVWADINNYTKWHDDLDYCTLEGPFEVGNYFRLKPKGAPAVKVEITELEENKKFIDCTKFFGAKMFDVHELKETEDGLHISNRIEVVGPLKFLWVHLVAKKVAKSAPNEMDFVVKMARKDNG